MFDLVTPIASGLALALWGALLGALVGGVIGLVGHLASGGRRDFASVTGMAAGRYDVVAAAGVAERAGQVLSEIQVPATAPTHSSGRAASSSDDVPSPVGSDRGPLRSGDGT